MRQVFLLVGSENATFLELDPELARVAAATQFLDSAEAAATSFHQWADKRPPEVNGHQRIAFESIYFKVKGGSLEMAQLHG